MKQGYQPPAEYMRKFNNDPSFFNHEYQKYIAHLANDAETYSLRVPGLASQTSSVTDQS